MYCVNCGNLLNENDNFLAQLATPGLGINRFHSIVYDGSIIKQSKIPAICWVFYL